MADVDPHTQATFAFAQLQRDPSFRARFPKLRNVYVCVESDLAEDVTRQAKEHFPDGGQIACYYPKDQRIMFVRHGGRGHLSGPADEVIQANNRAGAITIGMLVDTITQDPNWMDEIPEASTREVERLPLFG
jgi:hypothetical protein